MKRIVNYFASLNLKWVLIPIWVTLVFMAFVYFNADPVFFILWCKFTACVWAAALPVILYVSKE